MKKKKKAHSNIIKIKINHTPYQKTQTQGMGSLSVGKRKMGEILRTYQSEDRVMILQKACTLN